MIDTQKKGTTVKSRTQKKGTTVKSRTQKKGTTVKSRIQKNALSKSEQIRRQLKKSKTKSPIEIVKILEKKGIKVSSGLVSVVKHSTSNYRAKESFTKEITDYSNAIKKAKLFVEQSGGIKEAKVLIEAVRKIF